MIGTLPAEANPRGELRDRLAHLLNVDIPRLEVEVETDSDIAAAALERARHEAHDIDRLLTALDHHRAETGDRLDVVRLNDHVTVRPVRSRRVEAMVVHDRDLIIRARGFISVASPLGAALIGRRVGETVEVRGPGASPRFVIEGVCRA